MSAQEIDAYLAHVEEPKRATLQQLRLDDPLLAAKHFAFLVLSIPLDRALVCGDANQVTPAGLDALADAGVEVFLAAYGRARENGSG